MQTPKINNKNKKNENVQCRMYREPVLLPSAMHNSYTVTEASSSWDLQQNTGSKIYKINAAMFMYM
jgi:hypothetical protein